MAVNLNGLATEGRNPRTMDLDLMSIGETVKVMIDEEEYVSEALRQAAPQIEALIEQTVYAYRNGGRIVYLGAGTSGRLGLMDAVEVVPTFNSERFVGFIAGGQGAFVKAVEGAEDSLTLGVDDLKSIDFNEKDFLIGIAASGRTPYVIGALDYARSIGAKTGCVCCNLNTEIGRHCDYPIEMSAGPEIVLGSTRLKSGTCQKLVLNMISTITMVQIGKAYHNLMVDVRATNEKLVERCRRIVMEATGCDHERADKVLIETNNDCRLAILMILLDVSKQQAEEKLEAAGGIIRKAL